MPRHSPPAPPPSPDPDDCFEAARLGYTIKLTCWACGHQQILHPAALWWLFHKKRRPDTFRLLRQRAHCHPCSEKRRQHITNPILMLVRDEVTAEPFPLPSELEWKRELERRRR